MGKGSNFARNVVFFFSFLIKPVVVVGKRGDTRSHNAVKGDGAANVGALEPFGEALKG